MTRHRFDFDFGFSLLSEFFNGPWDHGRTVDAALAFAVRDRTKDELPGTSAAAILEDTLRLLESPLPGSALSTLWLGATQRGYDLEALRVDGRDWLRQVARVCTEELRVVAPWRVADPPEPVRGDLTATVMGELADIGHSLSVRTEGYSHFEVAGVLPALESVVTQVDPDLGFRLLLRTVSAYCVPIGQVRFERYEDLGEQFGFGEFHVNAVQFFATLDPDPPG